MVAAHRIEDQAFIGLEHIADVPGVVHGKLHAELVEPHARAGPLAVERQGHPGSVREVEGQVIGSMRTNA